jgi:predicted ATP-dependent endonuclease of OLD family
METDKINKNILEEISIKNFMGFIEANMSFAQPNGKKGSGLTIITGPNNSGKTSILEALNYYVKNLVEQGNEQQKTTVKHTTISSNVIDRSRRRTKDAQIEIKYKNMISSKDIVILSSIRLEKLEFPDPGSLRWNNGTKLRDAKSPNLCPTKLHSMGNKKKQEFNKMIKTVLPYFCDWQIDIDNGKYFIEYILTNGGNANQSHSTYFCGSGIISIIHICAALVNSDDSILVIDEPELSLSPQAQKNLAKLLAEEAMKRQIIITTHSPYFINWDDFGNGAKFVRTNINDDGSCSINTLKQEKECGNKTQYFDLLCNESWKRPHGFDLVAKEIFFSDKILLVEGQEDVGLLKKWLKTEYKKGESYNPPFEIFGYGADGVDNIPKLMEFAKDLGIKKVGILTDKLDDDKNKNIKEQAEKYAYSFQELNTNDIRDKINIDNKKLLKLIFVEDGVPKIKKETSIDQINECLSLKTKGYFDGEGNIKKCDGYKESEKCDKSKECKHCSLVEIFNEFDKYFTPPKDEEVKSISTLPPSNERF